MMHLNTLTNKLNNKKKKSIPKKIDFFDFITIIPMEYYVYAILEPNNKKLVCDKYNFEHTPFYIGYGKNKRINEHLGKREMNRKCHKTSKIISLFSSGLIPIFIKLEENLTFEEANQLEINLISILGRLDNNTGILTNHTDGGMGTKNKILSDETKTKMSKSHIGVLHSEETKKQISIKHKGKKLTTETKLKLSISKTRRGNAFYGKKHNLETLPTCKKVAQIDKLTGLVVNEYLSAMEAERLNNFTHIHDVCNGKRNSSGGYYWRYI